MSVDKEAVRARVLRGFLVNIGVHAKEGDVVDLPRAQFIFMKSANAVIEEPLSEIPTDTVESPDTKPETATETAEAAGDAAPTKKGKAP